MKSRRRLAEWLLAAACALAIGCGGQSITSDRSARQTEPPKAAPPPTTAGAPPPDAAGAPPPTGGGALPPDTAGGFPSPSQPPPPMPDPVKPPLNNGAGAPSPSGSGNLPSTNTTTVRVFFGTDRRPTTLSEAIFANEPSTTSERLSLGWCDVSIPRLVHRTGEIERPTYWTLNTTDWFENPDRHFVIQVRKLASRDEFAASLRDAVDLGPKKQILLFIHGYYTSFDDAVYRSAQLAVDLKFMGATALYSWPSNAALLRYAADRDHSVSTLPSFKRFVRELSQNSGAKTIHVIAHSMGNNALVHGLSELAREETRAPHFRQIIMAAPDVDRREFEGLADAFSTTADHFTLYAADNDRALGAAETLLGNPRVGDSRPMFRRRGLDSIDASSIIKGFLKHSYFADPRILADIEKLIAEYQPPPRFGLIGIPNDQRPDYWSFR